MNHITIERNKNYPDIQLKIGNNQYASNHHVHAGWSLSFVVNGTTSVQIGPYKAELTAGEYVSVPVNVPHLCRPWNHESFSFAVLYLPLSVPQISQNEFTIARSGSMAIRQFNEIADSFLSVVNSGEFVFCSERLTSYISENSRILSHYYRVDEMEFLDKKDTGTSRFQDYRQSRKLYGIGPKKIDIIIRVERAKSLIEKGVNITDAALLSGFYDQSHFTRVFKQHTGLTPSQYII